MVPTLGFLTLYIIVKFDGLFNQYNYGYRDYI